MRPDSPPSPAPRTTADAIAKDNQLTAALPPTEARSTPERLQVNVSAGCTTRLSDISDALNISAIRLGQALDALHLRHRGLPTQEASSRGLGHRWFNGCDFLVEWHMLGVTEVVVAYYDATGWPSKSIPKAKPTSPRCRARRGEGR